MAHYLHTNLFSATVYKWQVPGQKRVLDATNGTTIILNTNSLDGIRDKSTLVIPKSSMYYFDNPFDHRDNSHYMEIGDSLAQVITHMDASPISNVFTVSVYPDDDITQTAVNHTFKIADVARVIDATGTKSGLYSYLYVRADDGFRIIRYLIDGSQRSFMTLIEGQ